MKTLTKEDKVVKTPKHDLMVAALKHYEEASAAVHHWNSDIPKAITKYFVDQHV